MRSEARQSSALRPAFMLGAAIAGLAAGDAMAQAPASPTTADVQLPEVVVTAQRRSETIQHVPIAVDAYTREDLERHGATSIADVARFTPNVQISDSYAGAAPTWVIRGVGLQDFNPNNTPAASIFVDDVYQTSNVMGGASLFDVDRVEVLKGPQGGLYGRNTIGGAVQVITHQPDFAGYTGYADISYGSWGDVKGDLAVGGPITDRLAFRLAGTVENSSGGWQKSLVDGETWDKKHLGALRLELAAKVTNDLTVTLNLHTSENTSQLPLNQAIGVYNASGGFCAPVLAGHMNNSQCLDLAQVINPSQASPAVQGSKGYLSLSNPDNSLDNHAYGGSIKIEDKLGDMKLTSITSIDQFNYGLNYDFDGTSLVLGQYAQHTPMESMSESIHLSSNTKSALEWIIGLDAAYDRIVEHRYFQTTDNTPLDSSLHLPDFAGLFYLHYIQETQSVAIYGQGTYHFNEKLSLDFGLRESNETKNYKDGSFSLAVFGINVSSGNTKNYTLKDHFSGKIGLKYQLEPNILTYVSVSRGYKSGGFFGGFPLNLQQITPYREETVWAYEGGIKAETPEHHLRLNASIFEYNLSNYQDFSQQYSKYSHTIVNVLTNLGDATNRGAELEFAWLPVHGLTLQASGGYLDAEITKSSATFVDIQGLTEPYQGSRVPYAPRWSNDDYIRYERTVLSNYVVGVQLDYNYRSTLTAPRGVIDSAIGTLRGYGLLNARVELRQPTSQWTVAVYGQNIGNVRYRTIEQSDGAGDNSEAFGPPASYGVRLSKKF
jgi:iron complex outermembrane receptor protein